MTSFYTIFYVRLEWIRADKKWPVSCFESQQMTVDFPYPPHDIFPRNYPAYSKASCSCRIIGTATHIQMIQSALQCEIVNRVKISFQLWVWANKAENRAKESGTKCSPICRKFNDGIWYEKLQIFCTSLMFLYLVKLIAFTWWLSLLTQVTWVLQPLCVVNLIKFNSRLNWVWSLVKQMRMFENRTLEIRKPRVACFFGPSITTISLETKGRNALWTSA